MSNIISLCSKAMPKAFRVFLVVVLSVGFVSTNAIDSAFADSDEAVSDEQIFTDDSSASDVASDASGDISGDYVEGEVIIVYEDDVLDIDEEIVIGQSVVYEEATSASTDEGQTLDGGKPFAGDEGDVSVSVDGDEVIDESDLKRMSADDMAESGISAQARDTEDMYLASSRDVGFASASLTDNPESEKAALDGEKIATVKDETISLKEIGIISQEQIDSVTDDGAIVVAELEDDATVEGVIDKLEEIDGIAYAQPNYIYSVMDRAVNDPYATQTTNRLYQHYLDQSNIRGAWDVSTTDKSVTVAVIDSGCNMSHEDLKNNVNSTYAWDFINGKSLLSAGVANNGDSFGHGTMVCGLVSAQANNGIGIAGTSFNASVLPLRVLDDNGDTTSKRVIDSLSYVNDLIVSGKVPDLKVINMSIGGYISFDNALYSKIKELYYNRNVTIVCAGGNGIKGVAQTAPSYPADYPECISVTSLDESGANSTWSDYNSYKDISAPGENISSTTNTGGYGTNEGTSFASPIVAGVCALMAAYKNGITPSEIETILKKTAKPVNANPRPSSGSAGALDAEAALRSLVGSSSTTSVWTTNVYAYVSSAGTVTVTVNGAGAPSSIQSISVPVWGDVNGQNDIRWYPTTRYTNGNYMVSFPISNHGEVGSYSVHVYASTSSGQYMVGSTTFNISGLQGVLSVANKDAENATVTFKAFFDSTQSVASAQLPVWCSSVGGQDDIIWYSPTSTSKDSTGTTFTFNVAMSSHLFQVGEYSAHLYATSTYGLTSFVAAASAQMSLPESKVSVSGDSANIVRRVSVSGTLLKSVSAVSFPTWSVSGGQDDIVWYSGVKTAADTWVADVNIATHRTAGAYITHIYVTIGNNTFYVNAANFDVASPSGSISVLTTDKTSGEITYRISITSPLGISSVQLPVWCSSVGGQDDIAWYPVASNAAMTYRTYTCTVNRANHWYQCGIYTAHLYVTDNAGIVSMVAADNTEMDMPATDVSASGGGASKTVRISGEIAKNASAVFVPVWSDEAGQDDIVWYGARKSGDTWIADVALSNHRSSGSYSVHVYATVNGRQMFIGNTVFDVAKPTGYVSVRSYDAKAATITYRISVTSPLGISAVQLPVWCSSVGGQDDIVWYTPSRVSGNSTSAIYEVTVSAAQHMNQKGSYAAHLYVTSGVGFRDFVGAVTQNVS